MSIAYSIGGPTERGAAFLAALKDNYLIETNIAVCALVALILTVVALVWSGAGEARGRSGILFGLALFTAGAAHLAYILSLSRMWPRYYWLGIGLLSFATAVPVLVCKWPLGLGFTVMLAVLFVTPARLAHFQEMAMASADGRLPAEQANVLGIIGDHPELPIMSQWWGSSYEIFYLLRDERVWWVGNDPELLRNRTSLVVMNDHFADKTAPFYLTVRENCRGIPTGGERYRVFYCDGTRGWSAHGR